MSPAPQASYRPAEIWLTVGVLGVAVWATMQSFVPPSVRSASASAGEFSAERAMRHLRVIAQRSHPIGTTDNARVRGYLLDQLRSLNLSPEVQTATGTDLQTFYGPPYWAGRAQNVVVRLSGTNSTGAVLLMAHYDSVPTGPGAADDGSGVVALLETARALRSAPPLRNDLLFVFTDGEEAGLLGAQAFVDEHPWFRQVRVTLAFDSGGACGPATMFLGSHPNGWYLPEVARVGPRVVASSLLDFFVPGTSAPSDLWPAEQAGIPGFLVGASGCAAFYHTREDSLENLNLRSLQHLGATALALSRGFGSVNLRETSRDDLVYFYFLGSTLYYPVRWVRPLLALTVFALIVALGLGVRRKRLNIRGAAMGLVFWIFSGLLAGMLVATISWTLAKAGITKAIFLSVYNQETYSLGLKLLAIAIIICLYLKFRRRLTLEQLTAGGLLLCALFLVPACILAPGTSFVFMWPLWCGIAALFLRLLCPGRYAAKIAALLLSVPVVILFSGAIIYTKGIDSLSLTACIIAVGLLLPLLAPQLDILTCRRPWAIPVVPALLGLIVLGLAALGGAYNARRPRADSISYWLDADSGKAAWLSFDETPDVWTSQFLKGTLERGKFGRLGPSYLSQQRLLADFPTLRSEAPALKLPTPEVFVLRDSAEGHSRSLLLRINSPRRARVIWVAVEKTGVLRATVNGKTIPVRGIDTQGKSWSFFFHGLPAEGIDLAITIQRSEDPKITLMDQSDGLPQPEGYSIKPRPPDLMPSPWPPFDSTLLVSRTAILASSAQR